MSAKKQHGQFFTKTNPFGNQLFLQWLGGIPESEKATLLEPFAGANNIVKMIEGLGYSQPWACFDIDPPETNHAKYPVIVRDTLLNFPKGFNIAITNPPYLAKNSATRDGLSFPSCDYDDLYKYALSVMLGEVGYVAAIVPESFITSGLFHDRIYGVATLNCRMFDDTDCPVCLAMFVPSSAKRDTPDDFVLYKGNFQVGRFRELAERRDGLIGVEPLNLNDWKFNMPTGEIGLHAIDGTKNRTIRFVRGDEIHQSRVKPSSRSVTRIGGIPGSISVATLVDAANSVIDDLRSNTADVFLTAFKGLRADGDYRRRLDYATARRILDASLQKVA